MGKQCEGNAITSANRQLTIHNRDWRSGFTGLAFRDRLPFRRLLNLTLCFPVLASLFSCGGSGSNVSGSGGNGGGSSPDFTLSVSPSSLSLQQMGGGAPLNISIVPANGFTGSVSITFPNLPAGISFSGGFMSGPPFYASPTSPLGLGVSASNAAAVGNGSLTVHATSGGIAHDAMVSTSVSAAAVFKVNVFPSTVTIGPNGTATAQVTLDPGSNFGPSDSVLLQKSSVNIGFSGVSTEFSSEFLTAAQPQATITFQSGMEVEPGTYPVPLSANLGAQVINVPLALNVTSPAKTCSTQLRSTMRRTDMDTTGVVYDPVHKLVFAAVQQTNTVEVFSPSTAQTVANISIPAPRQLDITADGSRILVGTETNFMYWVDPVKLQVVEKVAVTSPLFNGWSVQPLQPVTLASGKVLVGMGGGPPQEWDPASNTWSTPAVSGFAPQDTLIRRSADHSKVLVATVNGNALAIFDSAVDGYGPVQSVSVGVAALNSNGSKIAVVGPPPGSSGGLQVTLFDQDLKVLATYPLPDSTFFFPQFADVIFSRDDSKIFVQNSNYVIALNATDLSFAGLSPSPGAGSVDYPSDIDETDMIFSPGKRTTNFTDASAPCALGVNRPFNIAVTPAQGPLTNPFAVKVNAAGITTQTQVYFGAAPGSPQATPGTNLSANPSTSIQVTPPPSPVAGAVNVTLTNPNGWLGIAPDAFSYGTSVLAVSTNSGPTAGGTAVTLYGYGLAFDQNQIQVTVGGNAATVTHAFAGLTSSGLTFPIDHVVFTSPAGNPGAADIVITTPAGAATVSGGFHYLRNAQSYAGSGSLTELVYDQPRQRLYAADGGSNVVNVFDLSGQHFLSPITVGKAPQAVAITPDSKTLVVANSADATVSIVDLSGANATKSVSVAGFPNLPLQCGQPIPYAVATTSANQAVIAITCPNETSGEYVLLNLGTLATGCGSSQGCAAMMAAFPQNRDEVLTVTGTPDGNSILLSNGITVGRWNVQADSFISRTIGNDSLQYPLVQTAAAADGTAFAMFYGALDPALSQFSIMQDVDYLGSGLNDIDSLPGEKLHASGALLYVPENYGLSIYDAHSGHLRQRVALTQATSSTFDAMAIDETGSKVFLLTNSGLAVVEIADLPLSIGNLQPAQGPATGGTSITVRGAGFQSGAQVLFNDTAVSTQFIDASTLHVTSPALPVGGVRVTVVNPNGSIYPLDDAFTAQ